MSIGKKIVQLREELDLSQRDLAKKLGVHYQSVGRWEREDGVPDSTDLAKLAELFKVPADFILFDDVPRDGKIDIKDLDLLSLFEAASQLDDKKRDMIKTFLKAFVFTEKFSEEFSTKAKAKR
jgi:transcriptional regulator with XRE-family HTH domain